MKKLGTTHENLDHKVHKTLKSMILEGKLAPGSKIYQDKIAGELAISRTPLVAALKKLEQERLVKAIPRRGFYVRRFSSEEMIHIFELREVLEGLAARRVSENITDGQIHKLKNFFKGMKVSDDPRDVKRYADEDRRFHHFLIEIGGNDLLSSILGTYSIISYSYQGGGLSGLVRSPKETIHEHRALIETISRRDPVKAEELARLHLRRSRERLKEGMKKEKEGKGEGKKGKAADKGLKNVQVEGTHKSRKGG
ncbi:MAG: GntR family transcriptional regulator [Syntrophaceae bacterium]|nr:GntR family transcriptional regulator [Syntrophaceae bacterium]